MHTLGIMTIHKKVIIIFQFKPLTFFFSLTKPSTKMTQTVLQSLKPVSIIY